MRRSPASLLPAILSAALVLCFGSARAAPAASGSVTIDGESWPVADAVAIVDDGDLAIVFSQKEFDRAEWAKDGEFDDFDVSSVKGGGDAQSLKIDIDEEDGSYEGHTIRYSPGSTSGGFSSDHEQSVALTARDAKHVAGTVKLDDGSGLAADVTFDLALTATGPLARAGKPLPAGGGEPGKALTTMVDATHAGDLDRMMALSHPERREGLAQAKAAGEADEMLKMARLFTPKIEKVTGGTVDGDTAWVEFDGREDGSVVKGTAELSRFEGKWYIKSINTKSGG